MYNFSKLEKLKNSPIQRQVRIITLVLKILIQKTFSQSPNLSSKNKLQVISPKKFPIKLPSLLRRANIKKMFFMNDPELNNS